MLPCPPSKLLVPVIPAGLGEADADSLALIEGEVEALGEAEALGEVEGLILGDSLWLTLGLTEGDIDELGLCDGLSDGLTEGLTLGLTEGDSLCPSDGETEGDSLELGD